MYLLAMTMRTVTLTVPLLGSWRLHPRLRDGYNLYADLRQLLAREESIVNCRLSKGAILVLQIAYAEAESPKPERLTDRHEVISGSRWCIWGGGRITVVHDELPLLFRVRVARNRDLTKRCG
jgi:hypothetical protein